MAKKQWIIGSVLMLLGVVFVIMSCLTPLIVEKHIRSKSEKKSELTSSNKEEYWGEIPGKLKEIVYMTYNFFHIENPDEVLWSGAKPKLTEKNGYVYQEFSDFVDVDHDGKDLNFFQFTKQVKTSKCIWSNSTKPTDKITSINMGAFYEWNLLKNIPRERMSLITFYDMFYVMSDELALEIYTRSLFAEFDSFDTVNKLILDPAGFGLNDSMEIWQDPYYGLSEKEGMKVWVQALLQNINNSVFEVPEVMTGALQVLAFHFTFTDSQLDLLFSGHFLTSALATLTNVYNWYSCSGRINNMNMCDPVYLASIQWSSSSVTMKPFNNLWTKTTSISALLPYLTGHLEISDYIQSTSIGSKYPNTTFSPSLFTSLFLFDWESGWPVYSPASVMDVGRMNNLFALGYSNDFPSIASQFNLPSANHSRVLWDYINSAVDFSALQGKYDPSIYDRLNRGISSELGLAMVGSQSIQDFFSIFSMNMPLVVSSLYAYTKISFELRLRCSTLVRDSASQAFYACDLPGLVWDNSTVGFQKWMAVLWYGIESEQGEIFMNISGLDLNTMRALFDVNKPLALNLTQADMDLKEHYGCENYGTRCSGEYMAVAQLVNSTISRNLPVQLENYLGIVVNSTTFYGLKGVNIGLTMPSEYYVFADDADDSEITVSEFSYLFSKAGLYTYQNFQRFFINIYSKNYLTITSEYNISNPLMFGNYLRKIINQYYFNGLISTKTVDQILFDYSDPLTNQRKNLSPLIGGDPTLDDRKLLLGKNQSRYEWEYIPSEFKHKVHSGKDSPSRTRKLLLINGENYLNYFDTEYQGEGKAGPIVAYVNKNPWQSKTKFKGTNGWGFKPYVSHSSDLYYTQIENCLTFPLDYKETKTRSGLKCYRFEIKDDLFLNVTQKPENKNYNNYSPKGLVNMTSVTNLPIFLSLPYFLYGDQKMRKLVTYTTPQFDFPDKYKTYFDVEKYSGIPLYQKQQFQYNFLLKPDLMFPNLSASSINSVGYFTYLPMYFTQRSYLLTTSHVDDHFKYIKDDQMTATLVFIIGLTVGIILIISSLLYALKIRITKRREEKMMVVSETRQPILLA